MQQDTNFLEDLLASLEVELEKADMIVTMIQRDDHTSSIHPMDIKRWAAERERVWKPRQKRKNRLRVYRQKNRQRKKPLSQKKKPIRS